MGQKIVVRCEGAAVLSWRDLVPIQGNLKSLSTVNFEKLKNRIVKGGFSFPFFVWRDGGKNYTLDGHQRLNVLRWLYDNGWEIPELPVCWVEAKDKKEAMRKILECSSQYGKIDDEGLYEFITKAEISTEETGDFNFDGLNLNDFNAAYGKGDGLSERIEAEKEIGDSPVKLKIFLIHPEDWLNHKNSIVNTLNEKQIRFEVVE